MLVAAFLVVGILTGEISRSSLYEIPEGYRGWVVIQYGDSSCPPLKSEGIYLVVRFSPRGRACTSAPQPRGWTIDRHYYLDERGNRTALPLSHIGEGGMIWAGSSTNPPGVSFARHTFFVGTEDELQQSWHLRPHLTDLEWYGGGNR